MKLLDEADIAALVEKFEEVLRDHRAGPFDLTFPYYPDFEDRRVCVKINMVYDRAELLN